MKFTKFINEVVEPGQEVEYTHPQFKKMLLDKYPNIEDGYFTLNGATKLNQRIIVENYKEYKGIVKFANENGFYVFGSTDSDDIAITKNINYDKASYRLTGAKLLGTKKL